MRNVARGMLCAHCGARAVIPLAMADRCTPWRTVWAVIPAHVEIPTCTNCGAEWIDRKTAAGIDAALTQEYGPEL